MTCLSSMNEEENKQLSENLGLVGSVVGRMGPKPCDYDEYFQEGCIGLLKAIRNHDPKRGKLSTLAYTAIRNQILNHIKKQKRYIRIKELVYEENLNRQ